MAINHLNIVKIGTWNIKFISFKVNIYNIIKKVAIIDILEILGNNMFVNLFDDKIILLKIKGIIINTIRNAIGDIFISFQKQFTFHQVNDARAHSSIQASSLILISLQVTGHLKVSCLFIFINKLFSLIGSIIILFFSKILFKGKNKIVKIIIFIKNNENHSFIFQLFFVILLKSIHHQEINHKNKNAKSILSTQKIKNHIDTKIIGFNIKLNKIFIKIYFLSFFISFNSSILNFNNAGIIKNIQAKKHKSGLKSNHQVKKLIVNHKIAAKIIYIIYNKVTI